LSRVKKTCVTNGDQLLPAWLAIAAAIAAAAATATATAISAKASAISTKATTSATTTTAATLAGLGFVDFQGATADFFAI
jgi:hypothetical protein